MYLKLSSAKWRPSWLGLSLMIDSIIDRDWEVSNPLVSLLLVCLIAQSDNAVCHCINTLRPRQNGLNFPDDTFNRIFLNKNVSILIKISLKFVPMCPIDNIPALFQLMAWHRPGDKPLSEPVMVSLLTHICVTRPQWVNGLVQDSSFSSASESNFERDTSAINH